jgi:hypothetical protein
MPHKHTRKRAPDGKDDSHFNLAPSARARPLPAYAGVTKTTGKGKQQAAKQKVKPKISTTGYKEDDTPRAFARMMAFQTTKKRPSGLDDETADRKAKRQKRKQEAADSIAEAAAASTQEKVELPKIQPGERLADYAARVDHALPVSGLARKGNGPKIDGMKERVTKTEKRLKKLYATWREEEAKIKAKEEEEAEAEEEAEDERRAMYGKDYEEPHRGGKRQRLVGEQNDGEEDPWAVLKAKRAEAERLREAEELSGKNRKSKGLKGVHDVVQAPPTLKVIPKEKFKVRNGAGADVANVPNAAGSLKRREELSDARRDVIERYRAMMNGKSDT